MEATIPRLVSETTSLWPSRISQNIVLQVLRTFIYETSTVTSRYEMQAELDRSKTVVTASNPDRVVDAYPRVFCVLCCRLHVEWLT